MKKVFGLCGIPRSGNTLFAGIINQNPKVSVTANSLVLHLYGNILKLKNLETYQNFQDEKSLNNVLDNLIPNYYKDWDADYIIDRSVWGFPKNLDMLKKYNEPKIIVLVRDVVEVLASFIKFSYTNETNYIAKNAASLEQRCNYVMAEGGELHTWLQAVYQLTNTPNSKYAHVIDYNDLVNNTEKKIDGVYEFLGIPKYDHSFTNLSQLNNNGIIYDDTVLGGNLHKIKTDKVERSAYNVKDILTPSIIERFNKMNFWENNNK